MNEIASAFDGAHHALRGPEPRETVPVGFLCAVVGQRQAVFRYNGEQLAARMVAHDLGLVRFSIEGDVVAMSNERETASARWLGNAAAFEGAQLHAAIIFEERPPADLVVDPCWTIT